MNRRLRMRFCPPCSISLSMVTSELSNDEQMDSASLQVLPSLGLLGKWSRRHCTCTHTLVIPVLSEHLQSESISQPLQNNVSEPCVQSRAISLDIVQYSGVLGESPGQTRSFSCKHTHGVHCTSSSTTSLQSTMRTLDSCSASTHTDGHACTIT